MIGTALMRGLVPALLLAAVVGGTAPATAREEVATQTEASPAGFQCSAYEQMLHVYLQVVSPPGAPIETRFDYSRLFEAPDRETQFHVVGRELLDVTPSVMDERTRLAWAINAYNFLVIRTLTQNLYDRPAKARSRGIGYKYRKRFQKVSNVQLPEGGFFVTDIVQIEGTSYSLDAFERHFLFADYERSSNVPPPEKLDPRAHFALVCAAKGCPPLLPECYRPDVLDRQLDFATRNALASPNHLRWNEERKRLEASEIFYWYEADFGGRDAAFAFLRDYAPQAIRDVIESRKVPWISVNIPWDWSINHTPGQDGADDAE